MLQHFDINKAIQTAGVLLRYEDGKMECLRLLKLLYIADRESVKETGRPITVSTTMAMDHGPLSSEVDDLIKGVITAEARWSQHIATHGHNARLTCDPGRGALSKYEIDKLNEISQRYEHLSTWQLANLTRDFREWKDNQPPQGSSRRIPIVDIIDAVGRSNERDEIVADLQAKAAYDRFFEGAHSESRRHVLADGPV